MPLCWALLGVGHSITRLPTSHSCSVRSSRSRNSAGSSGVWSLPSSMITIPGVPIIQKATCAPSNVSSVNGNRRFLQIKSVPTHAGQGGLVALVAKVAEIEKIKH